MPLSPCLLHGSAIGPGSERRLAEQNAHRDRRHASIVMAHASHEPAGPSERHAFRFRNRTCAGVKGLAARETIWPLRHRFGLARQAVVMGVDILGAEQYRYRERKYRLRMPQPFGKTSEPERPLHRGIGHRIGAGIGRHRARHVGTAARKDEAMHELRARSEEHTSELQSLMRISYAVFCLKKTKHIHT